MGQVGRGQTGKDLAGGAGDGFGRHVGQNQA
jgi:hypothetical protein